MYDVGYGESEVTFILSAQLSQAIKNDDQQQDWSAFNFTAVPCGYILVLTANGAQRDFLLSSDVISDVLRHWLSAYLTP